MAEAAAAFDTASKSRYFFPTGNGRKYCNLISLLMAINRTHLNDLYIRVTPCLSGISPEAGGAGTELGGGVLAKRWGGREGGV